MCHHPKDGVGTCPVWSLYHLLLVDWGGQSDILEALNVYLFQPFSSPLLLSSPHLIMTDTQIFDTTVDVTTPFTDIPAVSVVSMWYKVPFPTGFNLFHGNWHFHSAFPSTPPPRPSSPDSVSTGLPQREIQKFWTQTTTERDGRKCSAGQSLNVVIGIR